MLTGLAIRDVVLIEALDLEFGRGLGALTGETGAGKSILLDALGLALGERADSGLVRQGAAQAVVTASFELPGDHAVAALLADNGLAAEPGEPLMIRRVVRADGGSRGFVNDQPTSAGLLRELGGLLVEIHGQHDDRGLLNPRGHRALLDSFGRIDGAGVAETWRAWGKAEALAEAARHDLENANRDREWLEHAVAELAALDAGEGEEEALAGERSAMQKGARLAEDLAAVTAHLDGSEGGLAARSDRG
jgi:DNA repair protein RecN (Recombination protein N)